MAQPCGFERFKKDIFTVKKDIFTAIKRHIYSSVKFNCAKFELLKRQLL